MDVTWKRFFLSTVAFVLFIAFLMTSAHAAVVAVNAGGAAYTASDGTSYLADVHFTGGSTYTATQDIVNTGDDPLYQTQRYGFGSEFSYSIPIDDGIYDITLHFAELYYDNAGDQIFDVDIEHGEYSLQDIDILNEADGKFRAHTVTIPSVGVEDGELNITFYGAHDASVCAIEVNLAAPTAEISATPGTIDAGQDVTLSWETENATSVSIDQGIGIVEESGSRTERPAATTTYRITANGPGGTITDSVTVTVNTPAPTVTLSASSDSVVEGYPVPVTLSWTSENATSASIDNGVGPVDPTGEEGVSPVITTTYTITVSGPGGTASDSVTVNVLPLPTVDITATPTNVSQEGSTTLSWTSSNADTLILSPGDLSVPVNGTYDDDPVVTTTYTITATNAYGSRKDSVTVMVGEPPIIKSFTANPLSIVRGSSTTMTWDTEGADSVTIDGVGTVSPDGTMTVTPLVDTTYTLSASNQSSDEPPVTASVTITVSDPSTASISANPSTITEGEETTLTWDSTNADTASIEPFVGAVPIRGDETVSPAQTTTYTLTVNGPGGEATHSTTVTVYHQPTVSMTADDEHIAAGGSTTLEWTSTDADSASIDQSIGIVGVNGSVAVSPLVTTAYTITVIGPGGTAIDTATVNVHPLPTVSITSDLTTIDQGGSAVLSWTSTNAATATISSGIGHVDLIGTMTVSPLVTTTYTIRVEGLGGTASDSVTVSLSSQMAVAINCGGGAYTALDGTRYVADTYYTGGNVYSTSHAIAGTSDDTIYQSQRYGYGSDFSYAVPLANWNYDITFRFSEMYYNYAGEQVFSIIAEGEQIVADLDILSQAAKYAAYDVTVSSVAVSDGVLNLAFSGLNDAAVCAIEVTPTPPAATLTASINPITEGTSTILSWTSMDATVASLDQGIGTVPLSGTISVSPVVTTTYTLTVDGPGGFSTVSTTVTVNNLPTADITVSPDEITDNGLVFATLSWTTTNADTASIDNGVGEVAVNGTAEVSPTITTTYTLTATNPYGSRSDSVTVIVNNLPVINMFTASPNPITEGFSTTLSWTTTNAVSVNIENAGGSQSTSGSCVVSPTEQTTYTLTAINGYGERSESVTVSVDSLPSVDISASQSTILEGTATTLSWTSFDTDTLTIEPDIGVPLTPNTSESVSISPTRTTEYRITAENGYGSRSDSVIVTVNNLPAISSFIASSSSIIEGQSANLSWSVAGSDSVSINQGVGIVDLTGTREVFPVITTTYTLTAVNIYGTSTANVSIVVNQLPTVSISSVPNAISEGEYCTLYWSTSNATTAEIDEGIGVVTPNVMGNRDNVGPVVTTTYTLTAGNASGTRTASTTVTVYSDPVIGSFIADSNAIVEGSPAMLTWSTTHADSASIDNGVGAVAVNGSVTVTPAVTTTYTLTISNRYGSASESQTITVNHLPLVSLSVQPGTIARGESATLSWTTSNAETVSIDNGVGAQTPNTAGTYTVSPELTTTYTITAGNEFGERTAEVTVNVNTPPTLSISADSSVICQGDSAILTWNSTDADTVSIDQGIGTVSQSGSMPVSPTTDTSYTITATNESGTSTAGVSITVTSAPTAQITADEVSIKSGESVTLTWSTNGATNASIMPDIGEVDLNGLREVSLTEDTTFTISAYGCGESSDSIFIRVYDQPTVTISASPDTITQGQSSTLSWTTKDATSVSIDQGIGEVEENGDISVSPQGTTTYTITVEGPAGQGTDSVTLNVNTPPVIDTFTASPTRIAQGGSSTLTWTTTNATSASIDPITEEIGVSGSIDVSPSVTTAYTLDALNSYGLTTAVFTVVVGDDAPVINAFTTDTEYVVSGNSCTLSWSVSGAETDGVSIDPGIGSVGEIGSMAVTPSAGINVYTLSATNGASITEATVTIHAGITPEVSISASPNPVGQGGDTTLSWGSAGASTLTITPNIGPVDAEGSMVVSPESDITYTITGTNPYGTGIANVTIDVIPLPVIDSFTASPDSVPSGGSTELSWATTGADSVSIDQVGAVALTGTQPVTPGVTTTYTLTATNSSGSVTREITVVVNDLPTVSITADLTTLTEGETSILSWNCSNADIVTIDRGIGIVASSGSQAVTPSVTTTYTITATNAFGSRTDSVTVSVNTLPQVSIWALPDMITGGQPATLSWSSSGADIVEIDNGLGIQTPNSSGSQIVEPTTTTTYTITATNTFGIRTAGVTVTVGTPPTVSLSASLPTITQGQSTTLFWSSTGSANVSIDQGIGNVTASGSLDVSPLVTTEYTILAASAFGTAQQSLIVAVNNLPMVSIAAMPGAINSGDSCQLTWTSINADMVSIDPGIGPVAPNSQGSQSVSPSVTTKYTITASNVFGSQFQEVTVDVNVLPTVSIEASLVEINEGEQTILSWSSTNADTVSIDQGIGLVDTSGTMNVAPAVTTTYTINAANAYGSDTAGITVTVGNYPTITFSVSPATITEGESADLAWSCPGASEVSIEPGIGPVDPVGAQSVKPSETTTYMITATNSVGTRTADVILAVNRVPIASISADATNIIQGQPSTLFWSTMYAETTSINQGIGAVDHNGSRIVEPNVTTTYTIFAANAYGTRSESVTITVNEQPMPTVSISAEPDMILNPGEVRLIWSSTNADSVEIDQGIGPVTPVEEGSLEIPVNETTTYTITATNDYGSATDFVTVAVGQLPGVSISATRSPITQGESTTLIWESVGATACSIDQEIGVVDLSGNTDVSPSVTTTYTITATNESGPSTASVTVEVNQLPVIDTFTADTLSINQGQEATLSWTTTNADSASIDRGVGTVSPNGSVMVSPTLTTTYTLTATNAYGSDTALLTITVTQLPTASITANPAQIETGGSTVLSWTSSNATSVTIEPAIGMDPVPLSGSATVWLEGTTSYTITATNANGLVTDSVTVITGDVPMVDITATPEFISQGSSSTLSWTAANADTVSIDQGIGTVAATGTQNVTPAATTTYTVTASNAFGTVHASATVSVSRVPTVSMSASSDTITQGQTTTLSWTTTDADTVSIDQDIGAVGVSGYQPVSPSVTTTYTITATNAGGFDTDSVTINVNELPAITFSASASSIIEGATSTLSWTATNAESVSINQGIGPVALSGTRDVSPSATTTYAITASNAYGSVSEELTVTVTRVPTVVLKADCENILTGEPVTLSWTSTHAESASIDQGIGAVDTNGSFYIGSIGTDTIYTITVSGPGGTATDSVTIHTNDSIAVNLTASPEQIIAGEKTVLFWQSSGADSVSIDNTIGNVYPVNQGYVTVSPSATTTYTITAVNGSTTISETATVTVAQAPAVNIAASPAQIDQGQTATLTWSSAHAATAVIGQGVGEVPVNGSTTVSPFVTTTYTITVDGPGGTATAGTTVTVSTPPVVSITATPGSIAPGGSANLAWTSQGATSVSIDQNIGAVSASGNRAVTPTVTTTYTITATNEFGDTTDSVTVIVHPQPTVSISASPTAVIQGESTTLTWTSANAASASINCGVGSVDVNGSMSVSPAATTTYTLTVTGPGGTAASSVTVEVNQLPSVNLSASPTNVASGGSTTLTWSTANTLSVEIDQGIGAVALSGSRSITPEITTTYTITAANAHGDTTDTVTVMVEEAPTVDLSALSTSIPVGGATTLSWSSSGADTVSLNQGIGSVALEGTRSVTPGITTPYVVTAVNAYGTATDSVTITVSPLPTVNISASPTALDVGQASTLSWTSTNSASAAIDQGIGPVATNGSMTVAPLVTTTYTITTTGSGGTAQDNVTVAVNQAPAVNLSATPTAINPGGSATLSWTSTNATSASIDQTIGTVSVNGSSTVMPTVTTTYTITVSGPGGTATDSVTISVSDLPSVSISATPNPIDLSESTVLTWSSANAISVRIDQGIGPVATSGSLTVYPTSTRTYTITAEGPGGTVSSSVIIIVNQPPEVSLTAEPDRVIKGDPVTLTWTSLNTDSVSIDPEPGVVALNGSHEVYPQIPTLYTITATAAWDILPTTAGVFVGVVPRKAAYIPLIVDPGYKYSLGVMDLEIPAITYTIDSVGKKPFGVVPHPSLDYLYVACLEDTTIEKIDVFTGERLAVIGVVDLPRDIAITPDGSTVYVSLHNPGHTGDVAVIDTATDTLITTIEVINDAKALAISPDGSLLYVSSVYFTGSTDKNFYVSVVDTSTNTVIDTVVTSPYKPFDLEVSPDGSRVYMANLVEGLSYIVTGTNTLVDPVAMGESLEFMRLTVSPDGSRVYVAASDHRASQAVILVVDATATPKPRVTGYVPITEQEQSMDIKGMDIHPTASELYAIYDDSHNLGLPDFYVIDTTSNTIVDSLITGYHDDIYGDLLIIRP